MMMQFLRTTRIRTRLLVAYLGLLVIGFAALTIVAGGQISSAARQDFEQRLVNEIRLISQGVRPYLDANRPDIMMETLDTVEFQAAILAFETDVSGNLVIIPLDDGPWFGGIPMELRQPEIETALNGGIGVVERSNEMGQPMLYTASLIGGSRRGNGVIAQLEVPLANLQSVVLQRWALLGSIFALVTGVGALAALWISRSIIQPLYNLRESALRLSKGDLKHRVPQMAQDEIGEVAQAFNHMATQVESMLEEQRAFASNTSHELRTPLTTIRLRTEALRDDPNLESDFARQYIREIDDEVIRLSSLIEDLTLLSRLDAGRAELGQTTVDMGRFLTSMQHQFQAQATSRRITLTLEPPPEGLEVRGSLNHLTVVFRNLLDNALKYTSEGGTVNLRVQRQANQACIVIRDNGRGIAPEHLPHVFERFYRADKARSREVPGTGLGLSLVRSMVSAYGGTVRLESPGVNQGTCAMVCWPLAPEIQVEQ
jgi:signal transduction histidine kinase